MAKTLHLDLLLTHAHIATPEMGHMVYRPHQAIGISDGMIVWTGSMDELSRLRSSLVIAEEQNLAGQWVLPGLIDCHTHLVYAGSRVDEWNQRQQGKSYAEISAAGGGILSTVRATRAASEEELYELAANRLQKLHQQGVTGVEIKSGYGLDVENELKLLRVIQRLKQEQEVRIHATLLAAHAIPTEWTQDRSGYVQMLCEELIPEVARHGFAESVDAFCETIGFTLEETRQVFEAAKKHHLPVRLHAEQLSPSHGASLAAEYGALSVDHVEYLTEEDVKALARSGTVAVLLPGAYYFLQEKHKPPVQWLRDHGVPMAIATDHNPGTSPTLHIPLMLNMACVQFGLTPDEALLGVTVHAAQALGWTEGYCIATGQPASLSCWDVQHPHELCYNIG